jgi:hypothetical protein
MREPCMCGAPDCRVCGPLQGYHPCPHCKRMDCEDHEACGDAKAEAAEARAEAYFERRFEERLERAREMIDRTEFGGIDQ